MVDFTKLLGTKKMKIPLDPIEIFNNLDTESGKEYLRPSQESVLKDWYNNFRDKKDTLVKLHTGQGKTLIGLLMLQSFINEGKGPAVYLCPNNYLVSQTVEQAQSFGINTVQFSEGHSNLPYTFLNSKAILITNCNKIFNGRSVFGVVGSSREIINIGAIVMDDAHKCLDIIRESFSIIIDRDKADGSKNTLYMDLWSLFEESLKRQASGTCSDIYMGEDCFLAVPFWSWYDNRNEVVEILHKYKDENELKFVWDLLKNQIQNCICIFSGRRFEIVPRFIPIDLIPSFSQAKKRIFLSATLTEDAFLVRDIGIDSTSVSNPLIYGEVKYSGERLIIIPTLVDTNLNRNKIVKWLSKSAERNGGFGIVTISPSFHQARDWEESGAVVTNVRNLYQKIDELKTDVKQKEAKYILVLVNEYDGVDLPDNSCRILCLDSLPSYTSLLDKYIQEMRQNSSGIKRQMAQRVEQGIGRAIRGSNDWCIVIITGNNLTDFLSENSKRIFLSNEAKMQIKIGEDLATEMRTESGQLDVLNNLISQCLNRDKLWKEYYKENMSSVETFTSNKEYLKKALLERDAEVFYQQGQYQKAIDEIQKLIDISTDDKDTGWLFQNMAIYLYPTDTSLSMEKQLKAYTKNNRLFRPEVGVSYTKLIPTKVSRSMKIIDFIKKFENYNALCVNLFNILDKVTLSSSSYIFERSIDDFGKLLGFETQRPGRVLEDGPDNLWHINGNEYWIIECKNEVKGERKEISKKEGNQLNASIIWFNENYNNSQGIPIFIHPTNILGNKTHLSDPTWVMNKESLKKFKKNVNEFYLSFKNLDFFSLSPEILDKKLKEFDLDTESLQKEYLIRAERK